jgi:hypothetical protein
MASTLSLSPDQRWSAASWLFDWVLRTIAHGVADLELSAFLIGVIDENLGWLSLGDCSDQQRGMIKRFVNQSLLPTADSELPADLPNRKEVLRRVHELVDMVSAQ